MSSSASVRTASRPAITAVGIFLVFAACMSTLAGTTLTWLCTRLDRMWALNPTAYKRLAPLGGIVGPLFLLLSATMAVSLFDMLLDMEKALNRHASTQRGKQVEYFTIAWNTLEGGVAVLAGAVAGSNSLVGFGIDSFIEVISGTVLLWRMSVDADVRSRERNEKLSLRVVGVCFLALAVYVGYESISDLISRKAPEHSIPGIILACVSLVVMPLLSRAK